MPSWPHISTWRVRFGPTCFSGVSNRIRRCQHRFGGSNHPRCFSSPSPPSLGPTYPLSRCGASVLLARSLLSLPERPWSLWRSVSGAANQDDCRHHRVQANVPKRGGVLLLSWKDCRMTTDLVNYLLIVCSGFQPFL